MGLKSKVEDWWKTFQPYSMWPLLKGWFDLTVQESTLTLTQFHPSETAAVEKYRTTYSGLVPLCAVKSVHFRGLAAFYVQTHYVSWRSLSLAALPTRAIKCRTITELFRLLSLTTRNRNNHFSNTALPKISREFLRETQRRKELGGKIT